MRDIAGIVDQLRAKHHVANAPRLARLLATMLAASGLAMLGACSGTSSNGAGAAGGASGASSASGGGTATGSGPGGAAGGGGDTGNGGAHAGGQGGGAGAGGATGGCAASADCPGGACWQQLDGVKECTQPPQNVPRVTCQTFDQMCCAEDTQCTDGGAHGRCISRIA